MSRASNSLKATDVTATPIKLKYSASYSNTSICDTGIYAKSGINGPVTITGSVPGATLRYRSIRQLYYSNYLTGSYLTTTSSFDNFLQSTAASGTFEGNTIASASADVRYFPTESGGKIKIISIPQSSLGQQTSRKSFFLTGSGFTLVDDGNGNIIDLSNNNVYVGNIIYSQGFVIVTNPAYYCVMDGGPTTFSKYYIFDITQNSKTFNPLLEAVPDCAPMVTSSLALQPYPYYYFPSSSINTSNGVVTLSEADPITNQIGTYKSYYTVKSTYCGTSDAQPITVEIRDCVVSGLSATYIAPSPSPTPTPTISITPTITPTITSTPTISITPTTSITPSVTAIPSITPTISATPSITPTISTTPTITPTPSITPTKATPSATLSWSYTRESGGVGSYMDIKINGVSKILSNTTGAGVYAVYLGDIISVTIYTTGCTGLTNTANSFTDGIIVDASCTPNQGTTTLNSYSYTVLAGDIGTTISLYGYSTCGGGCN